MLTFQKMYDEIILNVNEHATCTGILRFINQILVFTLCVWFAWPYFNYKAGNIVGLSIFIMWFFTTDYMWLTKSWTKDLTYISMFFITFIPYIITGTLRFGSLNPIPTLGVVVLFFSGIFINHYYMYYKKDFIVIGRIALLSIIFYTIGGVQTYCGLHRYPQASRSLAHGMSRIDELYRAIGIGGYGFIFSSVFIVLSYCFILSKVSMQIGKVNKVFLFMSIWVLILVILKASYATAILFVFIGILLLIVKKNVFLNLLVIIILMSILFTGQYFIREIFLILSRLLENNNILQEKALEFAAVFLGEGEGVQISYRIELYKTSLGTFIKNPLFGTYGPMGKAGIVGGHAGWLDVMAYYGIFAVLPMFLGIITNVKKHLVFYKDTPYLKYISVTSILFFLLGFIKSNIFLYQIGLTMFLIVPSVPFLPFTLMKEELKNKS